MILKNWYVVKYWKFYYEDSLKTTPLGCSQSSKGHDWAVIKHFVLFSLQKLSTIVISI